MHRRTLVAGPALRPTDQEEAQSWDRLARHLEGFGLRLSGRPRQFAGGFGNLNYLIELDGRPAVLRRPPGGPIPPGGNDMRRESRILSGLWKAFPLAPRALHFSADESVLGAPFFIMEYRPGLVVGGEMPEPLAGEPEAGAKLGRMLAAILADLHRVDPAEVGLGDLGRPEGFLARTASGWIKRAELSWDGEPPGLVREIALWLETNAAPDIAPRLIHNDFKLDNVVLDPVTLHPVAVLDWDMGTRGDPLYDLAVLLSYYVEAGDPPAMHAMRQMPSAGPGFPRRGDLVEEYGRRTGYDVSDFPFRRVLAMVRTAVVFKQLHRRWLTGGTRDAKFAAFGGIAEGLIAFAHEIARGRAF
jgi:aminoglycoside phosphotransferase (APT) family kinase protein